MSLFAQRVNSNENRVNCTEEDVFSLRDLLQEKKGYDDCELSGIME